MTTPKELAEEFRRLAAEGASEIEARRQVGAPTDFWRGWHDAFIEAAQMVEERLNGA